MPNVVELVLFKLKEGVSEQALLAALDEFNVGFLSLQKGCLNRKLVKKDDTYADVVLWESMEDAMNAAAAIEHSAAAAPYCACVDESTCTMQHLDVIKDY